MYRYLKNKVYTGLFLFGLFASISSAVNAQAVVSFDPSSGYAEEEFKTSLVVKVPEGQSFEGFELEVVSNSIVEIITYERLDSPCSLEVFKKDGVVKVICLVSPEQKLSGEHKVIALRLKKTTNGEGEIFIQNPYFGEGVDIIKSPGSFVFEGVTDVDPTDGTNSVSYQGSYFLGIVGGWATDNYRAILVSVIVIAIGAVLYIALSKKRRIPSQLRLLTAFIVVLAAGTLFYSTGLLSDQSLDTRSRAGDQDSPLDQLESEGADLNGDKVINSIDFEIFKSDYREWEENSKYLSRSDYNNDRSIGIDDYKLFIELYNR